MSCNKKKAIRMKNVPTLPRDVKPYEEIKYPPSAGEIVKIKEFAARFIPRTCPV